MPYAKRFSGKLASAWRADAARFIQSRLGTRHRFSNLYKNFKHNNNWRFSNTGYVGWTAPDAKPYSPAAKAQWLWRRKYFKAHGRVI